MGTESGLLIYGGGGFAREVAWLAEECARAGQPLAPACFVDDNPAAHGTLLNGIPVLPLEEAVTRFGRLPFVPAVGTPKTREAMAARALGLGLRPAMLIHPRTERSAWIEIGEGAVVCAGCILTCNIVVGPYAQVNLDCTIGHDVVLGAYATLAPGVHVSGCVQIGARAYIGTGAAIINGTSSQPLIIGDDAVVGAGACVTRSVAPGTTVVGVPARPR